MKAKKTKEVIKPFSKFTYYCRNCKNKQDTFEAMPVLCHECKGNNLTITDNTLPINRATIVLINGREY